MTPVSPAGGEVDVARLREVAAKYDRLLDDAPWHAGCHRDSDWMVSVDPPTVLALLARLEAAESARDEALAVVRDLLATLDRGAYRFEEVHVRADLNYLLAALTPSAPTEEPQA